MRNLRLATFCLLAGASLNAGSAPAQQRPVFEAIVGRVRVDVIVTDDDGVFVGDLGLEDFLVYEDGQPQRLVDVQLVDLSERQVLRPGSSADLAGEGANVAAGGAAEPMVEPRPELVGAPEVLPAPAADTSASDLAAVVYLVDGLSLSLRTKLRFVESWEETLIQQGDLTVPHAVYMINGVGQLQELAPLTLDIEELFAAAGRVREVPLLNRPLPDRLVQFHNETVNMEMSPAERQVRARLEEEEELARSVFNLEMITAFCQALAGRSGRKALVWVTAGVKAMNGGPFTVIAGSDMGSSPVVNEDGLWDFRITTPDARVREKHQELTRAANSTNVSIYALDPSSQYDLRGIGGSAAVGMTGGGVLGSDEMLWSLDMMRDELRNAASDTGGKSFIAWSDLDRALVQIEQDTARFYLLTYEPPLPGGDGEYHEIRVEVRRPDVDVRARSGYVEHPRDEKLDRLVSAALALPGTIEGLPISVEAFRFWGSGDQMTLLLAAGLDSSEVQTSVRGDGSLGASLRVHVRVFDEDREVAAEADDDLTAQVKDSTGSAGSTYGSVDPEMVIYRRGWALEPGVYDVRVALLDEISGKVGAARLDVEVPDETEGWRTSDLMLIRTESSLETVPIVRGRFEAGESIGVLLEVRDGVEPVMSGLVLADLGELAQGTPTALLPTVRNLASVRLREVGAGLYRGGIEIPTDLPPGRYVLWAAVTDEPADQEKTFEVLLEILPPSGSRPN